ncbi:molybdenum ABC transporter ATP-binding protein [Aureimonas pseudogalii]|uniref:Molybdate transport system ATP-binding protein n=1 Tax=Aureimonas pseudogalii TaxID=1744844 RepID=A0A7W6EBT2_9HYPH|nr:molybdenum ABC transporter ATP-binding protein [Aureimonas pseudogalii]MBB3997974.1 molybdate transport system ATP-binding protein [Aureimonas pseudogalii]
MTGLEIDLSHRLGVFQLDARFTAKGGLTALFGPSGSGKSSLVNLVAGLVRPDRGRIAVGDRVLVDTEANIFVPPHRRRVGYVFQDARLFPHLSVRRNLLYGRWFTPAAERRGAIDDLIDLLGIGPLMERRPAGLSGGERQRVAIGRALLASPRLLLMDEPLAALDDARKEEVLPYIQRLREGMDVPILYVSHSVPEVLRLAHHLVVLDAGRVVADGTPEDIFRRLDLHPTTAELEPGHALDTRIAGHDERFGLTLLDARGGRLAIPIVAGGIGAPLRIRIRARDVMISMQPPVGLSALNGLVARVTAIHREGRTHADIQLDCGGDMLVARITQRSLETMGIAMGSQVHAVIKAVSFERDGPVSAGTTTLVDLG